MQILWVPMHIFNNYELKHVTLKNKLFLMIFIRKLNDKKEKNELQLAT